MRELDRRIATLRLRLAEISAREDQLKALQREFRSQLDRVMDYAIFERGDLESALSMAEEVDTRLIQAERSLGHLQTIKARGQDELDALMLTRSIEAAKADVAELEAQFQELDEEIIRLQQSVLDSDAPPREVRESRLGELRRQQEQIDGEIRHLRQAIGEASDEAARTVSERAGKAGSRVSERGLSR